MDLVYLYGPPAVGKLTIATELARRTGFKVFHNHLSIDCVKPVFDSARSSSGAGCMRSAKECWSKQPSRARI